MKREITYNAIITEQRSIFKMRAYSLLNQDTTDQNTFY